MAKPTYNAYSVREYEKDGKKDSFWTKIGVAFARKNGRRIRHCFRGFADQWPDHASRAEGRRTDRLTPPMHQAFLRRCPFCGGRAFVRRASFGERGFLVSCAHTSAGDPDMCAVMPSSLPYWTVAAAVRAWNRRAPDRRPQGFA